MKFTQRQIFIIAGAVVLLGILAFAFLSGLESTQQLPEVNLTIWGIEEENAFQELIQNYTQANPNVKMAYERLNPTIYRSQLLDALASGKGPDIFMIHNRSWPREVSKLVPADPAALGLARLREIFPTVVEEDFVGSDGLIYALPLYVDTMALLYNKDSYDQVGITGPPRTWNDFVQFIPHLRVLNENGQIAKAAAAIGGSEKTVKSGVDLLNLLMMQNGAQMTNQAFTAATFASDSEGSPGLKAFDFYLQFANAASPYYTWNDSEMNSIDSFAAGKTAMMFGYRSDVMQVKNKSPFLNLGVALMPQGSEDRTVTYADYWGLAVSKQSANAPWAWDFIISAATKESGIKPYLDFTLRPPALRSMIGDKFTDPDFGVFARQALTARSWYQADEDKVRDIFNSVITAVLTGQTDSRRGLSQAQDQVSQLMR